MGASTSLSGPQARTRAAILAATAAVLARDRSSTLPDIANVAGVGRTTLHRYFPDRETLIHEATVEAARVIDEAVCEAATEQDSATEAMRRLVAALVSAGDQIRFLFGDRVVTETIPTVDRPSRQPIIALIERGQREGVFDSQLSVTWTEHALYALVQQGCEDAAAGDLQRHVVAPTVIRTFECGIRTDESG